MKPYLISIPLIGLVGICAYLITKLVSKHKLLRRQFNNTKSRQVLCDETTQNLRKKIVELEISLQRIEESSLEFYNNELASLNDKLKEFEATTASVPLPVWFKNLDGILLYANLEYEKMFLTPRGFSLGDYIGNTDFQIWPEEVALEFKHNDDLVCNSGKPYRSVEGIQDEYGVVYYVEVLKYPRFQNDKLMGVSGLVLRVAEFREDLII